MSRKYVAKFGGHQCFEGRCHTRLLLRTKLGATLILVVAVMAGLLGAGQLNSSYAQETSNWLDVKYNLFARYHALSSFQIHVRPGATRQGKVRLYLNQGFVENIELRKIQPQPESVTVGVQSMIYTFNVPEDSKPFQITYQFEPNIHGRQTVDVSIQDGSEISFNQFILP